ncbi:MAG: histidine--tRNA ligase [Methanolinea sp.]|nr:histidine--tRNA ligase [Methanolinea sp.]
MLQKPRGTRDFLPAEMENRRAIESVMRETATAWGYREVCTPEFEEQELFTIRSGEGIIGEMYGFEDKSGRKLALRPELTAPVLRLYVNEGKILPKPLRWYYFADCFRYERPQKGRYRQFWQFGIELIGADSPLADAEVIMVAEDALRQSGIRFSLHIGHLGFMRALLSGLTADDQRRIRMFLDKKDQTGLEEHLVSLGKENLAGPLADLVRCRDLEEAFAIAGEIPDKPRIMETFSILDEAGIDYMLDAGIARGLDYYTGMVFEAFAENLGAENQVMGGGAYRLAHLFGGEDTPSCGFAIGFDRVMVARGEKAVPSRVVVSVVHAPEGRRMALQTAREFRNAGIRTEIDLSGKNISAQLSHAAKTADYALIVGERETLGKVVTLKNLKSGVQKQVPVGDAIAEVRDGDARR